MVLVISVRGRPEHRAEARAGARLQPLAHLLRDRDVGRLVVLAVGERQRADVERIALAVLADQRADDAVAAAAFIGGEIRHAAERRAERRGDRRHVVAQPVRDRLGGRAAQGRGRRDGDAAVVARRHGGEPHRVVDAAAVRADHRRQRSRPPRCRGSRSWQAEGGGGSAGSPGQDGRAQRRQGNRLRAPRAGAGAAAGSRLRSRLGAKREQRGDRAARRAGRASDGREVSRRLRPFEAGPYRMQAESEQF